MNNSILNERYYAHFNLEYNPFIKNNSNKYCHISKDINKLYFKLDYLLKVKGICVITGAPGKGKTTALRNYFKDYNKSLYKLIYISMTTLTTIDFYNSLITEFGYEPKTKKSQNYKLLQQIIMDYESKKITPIIIIDEANYVSSSTLNDLKMIFNFNMDSKDNYILILCGLPVLISNLSTSNQEPLRQRIITSFEFEDLQDDEVQNYIYSKLEKASGPTNIFDDAVIQTIKNASNGSPRIIDRIMDYALLIADRQNSTRITKDIIQKAISQSSL